MTVPIAEVLRVFEAIAPLALQEDWDNAGLLLAPVENIEIGRVLLTIDLTEPVLLEAIDAGAGLVLAYHPPIFKGPKRLTRRTAGERILIDALRANLFVYSPHTALDAAPGGINAWLGELLGPGHGRPIVVHPKSESIIASRPFANDSQLTAGRLPAHAEQLTTGRLPAHAEQLGAGRLVELDVPASLDDAIQRFKTGLGLSHLRVAAAHQHQAGELIRTLAVCAGAGGSVFERVARADLFLTGEMRHHDILARVSDGQSVVVTDHTNTERGYLPRLAALVRERMPSVELLIAKCDRDPLRVE